MIKWIFDLARANLTINILIENIKCNKLKHEEIIAILHQVEALIDPSDLANTEGDIHFGPENDT